MVALAGAPSLHGASLKGAAKPISRLASTRGTELPPEEQGLLPAVVHDVRAYEAEGQTIIEWSTGSPAATIGFQVHRVTGAESRPIHKGWIAPPWSALAGATYRVVDPSAPRGRRQSYLIVERDENAQFHLNGPFELLAEPERDAVPPVRGFEVVETRRPRTAPRRGRPGLNGPGQRDVIPGDTPGTVAKAMIRATGLYRVTAADLALALDQTTHRVETFIDRGRISIENQGQSVAWTSDPENTELRFYATAIDSAYTLDNVYWITLGQAATTMATTPANAEAAAPGGVFQSSSRSEEDLIPAINATRFEGADFWYWDGIRAEDPAESRKPFPLASPGVATGGGEAQLTVRLAGATKGSGFRYHNAVIYVNGTEVGSTLWMGLYIVEHTVSFDASLLQEENTIEVEGTLIEGAIGSAFFVDSFALDYPRYYQAQGNALELRGEGHPIVTVEGLAGSDAVVLDLADPARPTILSGVLTEPDGAQYRASFTPEAAETPYLVTTESAMLAVDRLVSDTFYSDPWQSGAGHDYVIIVPEALRGPAARLMAYRQAQGLDPYLLVLEDLYDYYSAGVADPWAVRDFLAWAEVHWATPPSYVFLVGKGSFDPRDYLGEGDNLITPIMVATPYGMAASDNMLADIDGDRQPDVAIGRLPVLTSQEFEAYIDKVIAFETATGAWLDEALMLADDPDASGDFTSLSNQAIGHLPEGMSASTVYLQELDITTARDDLFSAWNQGQRLVNYIGHGGVDVFAAETLLSGGDMPNLEGSGPASIVSALSCVVGQFELPGWDSLSEALVGVSGGGAVTVWAPTSPSYSGAAQDLNHDYFDALDLPGARVGDAVLAAIQASASSPTFLLETYTLLGDPATLVR